MEYRILITGVLGFVGRHIVDNLLNQNLAIEILGIDKIENVYPNIDCPYLSSDLTDTNKINCILKDFSPTHVIHLAGLVGRGTLEEHINANLINTDYFYKAVSELQPKPKVIQAGSAAAYGWINPGELPVFETQPFRPVGPYGLSKAAQDMLAESYFKEKGLPIVRARIFNLSGPGQNENLVPMTFVHQFKNIKNSAATRIRTGNLSPTRDFIDIRDVASALFMLALSGRPGEAYNIAGEEEISIRKIMDMLIDITGIDPPIDVENSRLRTSDITRIYADCSKIKKHTDWAPERDLKQSLYEMWRQVTCES